MIFVLRNVIYIVYDRKNENHWSSLITRYSEYKHPFHFQVVFQLASLILVRNA